LGRVPTSEDLPLQTDWLRLKGHIVDPATGYPTLAAVLDDVRRLLERREIVALIYLDVGGGLRVESQHGWQAYDETVRVAAEALRSIAGGPDPIDHVAVMGARSDKFVLFAGGGPSETLETAEARAKAARDAVAAAVHTACRSSAAPVLTGVALVRRDPMLRAERAIHRALDEAMFRSLRRRSVEEERQALWLDDMIRTGRVVSVFQPIVDLGDLHVVGHEVFTRGPAGGLIEDSDALFALAERTGRSADFERLCRRTALLRFPAGEPGHGRVLFLKTSPAALHDAGSVAGRLAQELDGTAFDAHDVVIEVEERLAALDREAFRAVLRALKGEGFRIAIDDMGAGYSSLQSIAEMEPDFLKFDMSLVRHLDRSPIKRSLLETVVRVSDCVQAPVIAEGIETAGELATIRDMGVPLGQGRHLLPEQIPDLA
jgi:EAL domain-containing protein (putative c-di-GMP-specific phosphodiesterase class I)